MRRDMLVSPIGLPCIAPPWGTLSAVDLRTGEIRWQIPHGSIRDLAPVPLPLTWGVPGLGGPIVTDTGVVLIAAAMDDYLRAFDVETGEELWKGRLPAGGQATPISYRVEFEDGTQRQVRLDCGRGSCAGGISIGRLPRCVCHRRTPVTDGLLRLVQPRAERARAEYFAAISSSSASNGMSCGV